MNTKTLYIIGNGFDRYHGLDTCYHSFAFYLQENYEEIYESLTKYFFLTDLDPLDESSFADPLWADFENELAELDYETVLEDNTDYLANVSDPDFRDRDWHSYQIQMEMIVDKLTKELFEAFKQFILSVTFPEQEYYKLLNLVPNSLFLNFNYTDSLEKYYGIKSSEIQYIHGKAKNEKDVLILGHGIDPNTFLKKEEEKDKPPVGLSEEEMDIWKEEMGDKYDYSYDSGKSEILSYFSESYKYTEDIIRKHSTFFDNLVNVEKVFVLGHSLSTVDQPYFVKVIQSIRDKNIPWTVTYFTEDSYESHLKKLLQIGLRQEQINLVKMESLRYNHPTLFEN